MVVASTRTKNPSGMQTASSLHISPLRTAVLLICGFLIIFVFCCTYRYGARQLMDAIEAWLNPRLDSPIGTPYNLQNE